MTIKDLLYKQCPACKGKGYTVEPNSSEAARTSGAITLCVTCLGTGAIKNHKEEK